jgi:hypothetical protein
MHRWLNHRFARATSRPARQLGSCASCIALAYLLGSAPACLNPDISDEDPLSTLTPALDVDDEDDTLIDEQGQGGDGADEAEPVDDALRPRLPAPDPGPRMRPRRITPRR